MPRPTEYQKISIIMATYNEAGTVRRCLESIKAQTYRNIELIVIDGGSSDGTLDLLKSQGNLIDYWQSEPDRGIYHAWNKGLDHVTGDWVHFLGADDYFPDPDVLIRVARVLSMCEDKIRVAYGKAVRVSSQGRVLETWGDPWKDVSAKFRHAFLIPHPATFHRTGLFDDLGRFDESFVIGGDYDFLLRELKDCEALFLDDIVVKAVTSGGLSTNWDLSLVSVREMARAQRLNGIYPYTPGWILLVLKALTKRMLVLTLGASRTRFAVDLYRQITGRPPIWRKNGC